MLGMIIIGVSAWTAYGGRGGALSVRISAPGKSWVYPLDARKAVTVDARGPLGVSVIRISGGAAWFVSSPCKNKVCIEMGKIHTAGAWAACLPNKVMISIEGTAREDGVDAGVW
jgi:hypothetical protein